MRGWLVLLLVLAPAAFAGESAIDRALESGAFEIAARIDSSVVDVLPTVDGLGGKLLALRSYLRSGDQLQERWSWTQARIAAYEGSAEQVELQSAIQQVRVVFEQVNPGYELFVNPQVRSLDIQLASWNRNESVAAAAARLLEDARIRFAAPGAGLMARNLETFLQSYVPVPVPTVAAPGLSPHGQMLAIDFQVLAQGQVVAGPDSRTIEDTWERGGWAQKLDAAIRESSSRFIGPLVSPREPWHYTYAPDATAGR